MAPDAVLSLSTPVIPKPMFLSFRDSMLLSFRDPMLLSFRDSTLLSFRGLTAESTLDIRRYLVGLIVISRKAGVQ